jgi:hypothetical protein
MSIPHVCGRRRRGIARSLSGSVARTCRGYGVDVSLGMTNDDGRASQVQPPSTEADSTDDAASTGTRRRAAMRNVAQRLLRWLERRTDMTARLCSWERVGLLCF